MKSSRLCKALTTRIEAYFDQAKRMRRDSSPDAIHDFRVASRYLMAIEPLLRNVSDTRVWRKTVKHGLKSLTHLRDLHVFRERFSDEPGLLSLLDKAVEQELEKTAEFRREAGHSNNEKMIQHSFQVLCASSHKQTAIDRMIHELWLKHWTRLNQRLQEVDYSEPSSIHRLRISFKPFRYTASFLHEAELIHIPSFDEFKYWQDIMGDINDLEVVSGWLQQTSGHASLAIQLSQDAARLRKKLGAEASAFHGFIEHINTTVLSEPGDSAGPDT